MKYSQLIGKCANCLGCNRLEDINFRGTYRCEYATSEQIDIEKLREEIQNEKSKN